MWAKKVGISAAWVFMPLATFMATCGLKPKTILALSVQSGLIATSPMTIATGVYAGVLQHFIGKGAWYPKGGGQIFSAAFGEVVLSHGGEIRTDTKVERILIDNGQVTGVRLDDGEIITTKAVISNADIKKTYKELVGYENLPKSMVRKNENWKMALPLINNFFGIEIDLSDAPNSNYFAIPNWDDAGSLVSLMGMSSRLFGKKAIARDPIEWATDYAKNQPAYLQTSTRRDPSNLHSAPKGHAAIEVQTLAPFRPELWGITERDLQTGEYREKAAYKEVKEIISGGLLQRVEQIYPGSSSKVRFNELGTPATQSRYTLSSGGAGMGLESRSSQFGPFRPRTHTVIKGLYLSGCSTAWGPGTLGSMVSGVFAAGAVVGRDLHAEVRAGKVIADKSLLGKWDSNFDPLKESIKMGRQTNLKKCLKTGVEDQLV